MKKLCMLFIGVVVFLATGCGGSASTKVTEAVPIETKPTETKPTVEDTGWGTAYKELLLSDFYEDCYMFLYDMNEDDIPELMIGIIKPGYTSQAIPVTWDAESGEAIEDPGVIKEIVKQLPGEFPDKALGIITKHTKTADLIADYDAYRNYDDGSDSWIWNTDSNKLLAEFPIIPWLPINKETVEAYIGPNYLGENVKNAFYTDENDGKLRYRLENGETAVDTWITDVYGLSRYMDEDGTVKLGWHEEEGKEYFLSPTTTIDKRLEGVKLADGMQKTYRIEDFKKWMEEGDPDEVEGRIEQEGIAYRFDANGVAQKNKYTSLNLAQFDMIDPNGKFRFWIKNVNKKEDYYEVTGALEALSFSKEWVDSNRGGTVTIPLWEMTGFNNSGLGIRPSIVEFKGTLRQPDNYLAKIEIEEKALVDNLSKEDKKAAWTDAFTVPYGDISQMVDQEIISSNYDYVDNENQGSLSSEPFAGIALYEDITLIFDEYSVENYPDSIIEGIDSFCGYVLKFYQGDTIAQEVIQELNLWVERVKEVRTCSPNESYPLFEQDFGSLGYMIATGQVPPYEAYTYTGPLTLEELGYTTYGDNYLYCALDISLKEDTNHVAAAEWSAILYDNYYSY